MVSVDKLISFINYLGMVIVVLNFDDLGERAALSEWHSLANSSSICSIDINNASALQQLQHSPLSKY